MEKNWEAIVAMCFGFSAVAITLDFLFMEAGRSWIIPAALMYLATAIFSVLAIKRVKEKTGEELIFLLSQIFHEVTRIRISIMSIRVRGRSIGIPYDILAVAAGLFVGYRRIQGIEAGLIDFCFLFGPTIFAIGIISIFMFGGRYGARKGLEQIKLARSVHQTLEDYFSSKNIVKAAASIGLRIGFATAIGCGLGYLAGLMI